MAQAIKLNYGGKVVYPVSLSDLIIEPESKKTVTELLKGLKTAVETAQADVDGLSMKKINSLQYQLVDKSGAKVGDEINIPKDTFLAEASLVELYPVVDGEGQETIVNGKALKFVFNTANDEGGKADIYVPVGSLIHEYAADGTTIELDTNTNTFSVKSGVFASAEQGTAASSALQSVSGSDYIGVTAKASNSQTISAKTQTVADASSSKKGLAEASDVKSYVDAQDKIITDSIGGSYDSAHTVNAAIEALRQNQQESGNANALIGTSADTIDTITVWGAHNAAFKAIDDAATAQSTAASAQTAADSAQTTANTAVANAATAQAAAEAAQGDATQALSDAAAASAKVDTEIGKLNAGITGGTDVKVQILEQVGLLKTVTVDTTGINGKITGATTEIKNIIGGSYTSANTVHNAIEALTSAITNVNVDSDIAAAINALSASKSGSSHGVSVTVNTNSGNVSSVSVTAPDFDSLYDAKGSAASAQTAAIESSITYTNAAISGFVSYTIVEGAGTYADDLDQYVTKPQA